MLKFGYSLHSKKNANFIFLILLAILLFLSPSPAFSLSDAVNKNISDLSIPFITNSGQEDERVAFTARTLDGTLFVTKAGELVYQFPGSIPKRTKDEKDPNPLPSWVLVESFVDAEVRTQGQIPSETKISRFIGNDPSNWESEIAAFDQISLGETWPGIRVLLEAKTNNVEKLFSIAPKAKVDHIRIRMGGANNMEIAPEGTLIAHTGNGPVTFTKPEAWQIVNNKRKTVAVSYTLVGDQYGFFLGDYDENYTVIIDPLIQSTYLGGSETDHPYDIVYNPINEKVYVAGFTTGSADFPGTAGGAQPSMKGNHEAFVSKLSEDLTVIEQTTYIGGSGADHASGLAINTKGHVLVTGDTNSIDFPGAWLGAQNTNAGSLDAFVVSLTKDLKTFIGATYFGGSEHDFGNSIVVDLSNNNVFVAGDTTSQDLPNVTSGAQGNFGGTAWPFLYSKDAFAVKFNEDLSTVIQSTYIGGNQDDQANAIAFDSNRNVFITGFTRSPNFPGTAFGAQDTYADTVYSNDAFVTKLSNDLQSLMQSSYLGGDSSDVGFGIIVDPITDNVFVGGSTYSELGFPGTSGGAQPIHSGGSDAFITKFSNNLQSITQTTFLGGSNGDNALDIALDTTQNVFVSGFTSSSDFPGTSGGAQSTLSGNSDAHVARFSNDLTSLTQSTYVGGSNAEYGTAITLHPVNNKVFVTGRTGSNDFPEISGGAQEIYASGGRDGYVAKLTRGLHDPANSVGYCDGDPHIMTVNGIYYDFQAAGEFVALTDNKHVEIQTRQTPVPFASAIHNSHTELTSCVSINSAVAAKVGSHRITYQPSVIGKGNPRGMQLRIDGVLTKLTSQGVNLGEGARVIKSPVGNGIEVEFSDGTIMIVTPTWWENASIWYLNVRVYNTSAYEGIMGYVDPSDWLPTLPDGTSLGPRPASLSQRYSDLNKTFANAWRVTNDTSLFDYELNVSTAAFTDKAWPPKEAKCEILKNSSLKRTRLRKAKKLCRKIGDNISRKNCIADVRATGEPDFAKSYIVNQLIEKGATRTKITKLDGDKGLSTIVATVQLLNTNFLNEKSSVPRGMVQFYLDGSPIGREIKLNSKGEAKWFSSNHNVSDRAVVAKFVPNKRSNFLPSYSLPVSTKKPLH